MNKTFRGEDLQTTKDALNTKFATLSEEMGSKTLQSNQIIITQTPINISTVSNPNVKIPNPNNWLVIQISNFGIWSFSSPNVKILKQNVQIILDNLMQVSSGKP